MNNYLSHQMPKYYIHNMILKSANMSETDNRKKMIKLLSDKQYQMQDIFEVNLREIRKIKTLIDKLYMGQVYSTNY